jgi:gliding motility-associated-like protein
MRSLAFISLLGLLFSCNTDVDLIGDYKVTPIVYGLLDQSDSIHYIKIQKTFLGQSNALDMAQVQDSSYFDDVYATITETLSNGSVGRTWVLRDTLVENKDLDGVFFAPEQKLYYFATPTIANDPINSLQPDAKYRLDININNGQFNVSSETELISGVALGGFTTNTQINFRGTQNQGYLNQSFNFSKGNAVRFHFNLEFAAEVDATIFNRWGSTVGRITEVDNDKGWNGQDFKNGQDLPEGVYFFNYRIKDLNGDEVSGHGHVTLVRD